MTRMIEATSAAVEAGTGIALIADPSLVASLLLGASSDGGGIAVGRICGAGLLSLGLACWPSRRGLGSRGTLGLVTYNLFVALYLGYLDLIACFVGKLLWPVCLVHALFGICLARPAYKVVRPKQFAG